MGKVNRESTYHVPEGCEGIWLDKSTFVTFDKSKTNEQEVRAKFKARKGAGWELGYVEKYIANSTGSRYRRSN